MRPAARTEHLLNPGEVPNGLTEAEYRLIVETTSQGIWALDRRGRTIFANEAMAKMLGYSRDELEGRFLWEFIPEAEHALAVSNFEEVVGGLRGQLELRVPRKDGTKIWILVAVSPIPGEDGTAVGALGMATDIDDRKRAEYSLRTAEERYRTLSENLPLTTYQATLTGSRPCTYISRHCEELLGYPVEEWISDPTLYQRALHPDDRERVLAEIEEANRTKSAFAGEYRMVRPDGRTVWVRDQSIPVSVEGHQYALGFVIEITARRESERRLEAQHAVASILAERPPLGEGTRMILQAVCVSLDLEVGVIWRVDNEADVLRPVELWHLPSVEVPAFEAKTRSMAFARGQGLPGRVWEADEPVWLPMIEGDPNYPRGPVALREGLRAAFAVPITVRSEVLGIIEFVSHEIDEPDVELLRMMGVLGGQIGQFFDRTEAEERLREGSRRYQVLIETANDAFISIDRESVILEWNREAERLFGWTRDEAIGNRLIDTIVPPAYRDAHLAGLRTFLETGEGPVLNQTLELTALRRGGAELPIEITIWPTETGGSYRFNAFIRDISDRRQLEEELRQAQKMEAVGRLAGGVAHDFNNLLLAISGYSELALADLEHAGIAGEILESVLQIKRATDRASSLTSQLMAFGRKQVLRPDILDLNNLVTEVEGLARGVIPASVDLSISLAAEPCTVKVDPGQMGQAIMNLAINALDAIEETGRIAIETRRLEIVGAGVSCDAVILDPGSYVTLSISDTGIGMDEEVCSRIFEPFFTTKGDRGTGLGLPSVHGFVTQSNGFIFVESERGTGTTFTIYLPFCAEAALAA